MQGAQFVFLRSKKERSQNPGECELLVYINIPIKTSGVKRAIKSGLKSSNTTQLQSRSLGNSQVEHGLAGSGQGCSVFGSSKEDQLTKIQQGQGLRRALVEKP